MCYSEKVFQAAKTQQAIKEEDMQVQIVERSSAIDVAKEVFLFGYTFPLSYGLNVLLLLKGCCQT